MERTVQHAQRYVATGDEVSYTSNTQDGRVLYSIDGNFGLCRKKASGSSVRPPLHQQTKFFNQECVDQYVKNYATIKMPMSKVRV